MKIMKWNCAFLLAVIMFVCTISTTAYAAEKNTSSDYKIVYEFEITEDMFDNSGIATMSLADIDQTFNVYSSHTGSTRTYYGNTLRYGITITDVNGNPVDSILAVRLYNSNNSMIREYQFNADGGQHIREISISSGSSYYFQYLVAYGSVQTLKVRMQITSY